MLGNIMRDCLAKKKRERQYHHKSHGARERQSALIKQQG
jgi:hypothetical protein